MDALTPQDECHNTLLRSYLVKALAEADKCDGLVAIHIETALAILDRRLSIQSDLF